MSMNIDSLTLRFERFFRPDQATVLAETIHAAYTDLVKTSDFNELKEIVRDLAEAQERTEARVGELAESQNRIEARMEELTQAQVDLTQAQNRTEARHGGTDPGSVEHRWSPGQAD